MLILQSMLLSPICVLTTTMRYVSLQPSMWGPLLTREICKVVFYKIRCKMTFLGPIKPGF